MNRKTVPMRVDTRTLRAINMLAGEQQLKTGGKLSANDAVWELIREHRPDIAERAEAVLEYSNGQDTDEDD